MSLYSRAARGPWLALSLLTACTAAPAMAEPNPIQIDDDIPVCQEERPASAPPAARATNSSPDPDPDARRGASCVEPPYVRNPTFGKSVESPEAIGVVTWADFNPDEIASFEGCFDLDIHARAASLDLIEGSTSFAVLEVAYRRAPVQVTDREQYAFARLNVDVKEDRITRMWFDVIAAPDAEWSSVSVEHGEGKLIAAAEVPLPPPTFMGVESRIVLTPLPRGMLGIGTLFSVQLITMPPGSWTPYRVRRGVLSVDRTLDAKVVLSWYQPDFRAADASR